MTQISQCSTCDEAGLSEQECFEGDCFDGCGDCRDAAVAVGDPFRRDTIGQAYGFTEGDPMGSEF
jgi:hypothetical protein